MIAVKDADVKTVLKRTWFTSSRGRDVPLSGPFLQAEVFPLIIYLMFFLKMYCGNYYSVK